ncbi:MAG: hypothetical protein HYW48_01210 [Deltaproteobacteria bacterium]|nr:hypothetical protein [Deltaproteobacteria bacterium]
MEEPAAQFPPNHLLAARSWRKALRSFLQTTSLQRDLGGRRCAVSSKPPPCSAILTCRVILISIYTILV